MTLIRSADNFVAEEQNIQKCLNVARARHVVSAPHDTPRRSYAKHSGLLFLQPNLGCHLRAEQARKSRVVGYAPAVFPTAHKADPYPVTPPASRRDGFQNASASANCKSNEDSLG